MRILQKLSLLTVFSLASSILSPAQAVTINNSGFEDLSIFGAEPNLEFTGTAPSIGSFSFVTSNPDTRAIPNWIITGNIGTNAGTYRPESGLFTSIPNGSNVAFTTGRNISQVLTDTFDGNTIYNLSVFVGRTTFGQVQFPDSYTIGLFALDDLNNPTLLSSSTNPVNPSSGTFALASLSFDSSSNLSSIGQRIGITLGSEFEDDNTQIFFDNVSLSATPVPFEFSPATGFVIIGGVIVGRKILKSMQKK